MWMTHDAIIATALHYHVPPVAAPVSVAPSDSCANRGLWSDLPMETGIATLVCYAGVFGDVIGVEEISTRLGAAGHEEFHAALNKLHNQGRIIVRDGFAGLPGHEEQIHLKASKIAIADRLIRSRQADLEKLGRNPMIKFVGISGSLAARNPAPDYKNHLDMDIFLITRNQCLWLYQIPRSFRNMFFPEKKEPNLCINFIMDESSLEVSNKNLFTATDIRNLIPISGSDAYQRFLQVNRWVNYYYPGFSSGSVLAGKTASGSMLNKCLYFFHAILRSVKHLSIIPLRELSFKMDPSKGINFNRLSNRSGGFQLFVHNKFSRLSARWFPDLVDAALIEKLFPDELSTVIRNGATEALELGPEIGLMFDSKYG
jgi:hypothetical protein